MIHLYLDNARAHLQLSSLRCLFWEERKMLICADIHNGKGAHFSQNGITLPALVNKNNFWNLAIAFEKFRPEKFLVLGDMMHSTENYEWAEFEDFMDNYPEINRILVRGNHELYGDHKYADLGFEVFTDLTLGDILFTHEPLTDIPTSKTNICGHIHPAIRASGSAGQSLRLPCFWVKENQIILPAFGTFTGMHSIKPRRGERIFAIANEKVIELNGRDSQSEHAYKS
jgi:DNA ligase-associated metallophosphoesterase